MRKLLPMLAVAVVFSLSMLVVRAAEDTEKTLKGETDCAKCTLKEAGVTKCKNVLTVEESGKKVHYYLTKMDKHRELFCQGGKKVEIVGVVTEKDGKKELKATSIKEIE